MSWVRAGKSGPSSSSSKSDNSTPLPSPSSEPISPRSPRGSSGEKEGPTKNTNIIDKLNLKKKRASLHGLAKKIKDNKKEKDTPAISKPTILTLNSNTPVTPSVDILFSQQQEKEHKSVHFHADVINNAKNENCVNNNNSSVNHNIGGLNALESATNHPYYVYLRMMNTLMNAIGLDDTSKSRIEDMLIAAPSMKQKKFNHLASDREVNLITYIKKDVDLFINYQNLNRRAIIIQTLYRRHRAYKRMHFVHDNYNKAKVSIFQDIVRREKKYIMNLATIVSQYIMPLKITTDKQLKELSPEFKIIFSNIEEILSVHQMILNILRNYSEKYWPQIHWFGYLITEISHHFKVYGTYVNNFKFARDTLAECMQNARFAEFVEAKFVSVGMDINMLLSLPLNHMSGYELCMKNLLDLFPAEEDEASYLSMLSALTLLIETNNSIRNSLEKADNIASIQRIRRAFPADITNNETIESYLRNSDVEFVSESAVDITIQKKFIPGVLIIFNNSLAIGTQFSKVGITVTNQLKYLYNLEITRVQEDENDPLSFDIFIVNEEKNTHNHIVENSKFHIHLKDQSSLKKLISIIQTNIAKNQRNRIYGVDLDFLLEREKSVDGIPRIVKELVDYLVDTSLDTVGLFRIPGSSSEMKRLKLMYNNVVKGDPYPNLYEENVRSNDAAGLLKLFFSELPNPLCTFQLFNPLMETQSKYTKAEEVPQMLQEIKALLLTMPPSYRILLQYMIEFFLKIIAKQEVNKMSSMNLALCFGANIIRPEEQTVESALSIPIANGILARIIDNFEYMFDIQQ